MLEHCVEPCVPNDSWPHSQPEYLQVTAPEWILDIASYNCGLRLLPLPNDVSRGDHTRLHPAALLQSAQLQSCPLLFLLHNQLDHRQETVLGAGTDGRLETILESNGSYSLKLTILTYCRLLRTCLSLEFAEGARCFETWLVVAPRPSAKFAAEASAE